jgi:hypothetical protein
MDNERNIFLVDGRGVRKVGMTKSEVLDMAIGDLRAKHEILLSSIKNSRILKLLERILVLCPEEYKNSLRRILVLMRLKSIF